MIEEIEGLKVGPDEVLVLRLPDGTAMEAVMQLRETLIGCGLRDRSLILVGQIEVGKVHDGHIGRLDKAVRTLAYWCYQAQTGLGERDVRGIDAILDGTDGG